MAEYLIKDSTLTEIADAIREKTGKTDTVPVSSMAEDILSISVGGAIEDIGTEAGMNALLISANIGKAYRFIGETTETYVNGDIYIVEESK